MYIENFSIASSDCLAVDRNLVLNMCMNMKYICNHCFVKILLFYIYIYNYKNLKVCFPLTVFCSDEIFVCLNVE